MQKLPSFDEELARERKDAEASGDVSKSILDYFSFLFFPIEKSSIYAYTLVEFAFPFIHSNNRF